jgi:methionyl-tRNA formyltransferase
MKQGNVKSIRARLKNISDREQIGFQFIITRYFHERLLYRIAKSEYVNNFILKGGTLLYAIEGIHFRPTIDIDILANHISNENKQIKQIFRSICSVKYDADGVNFDFENIETEEIAKEDKYSGVRIFIGVQFDTIKQRMQIDIGFSDIITSAPVELIYPTLLNELPKPEIKAYSIETIIAEKFQAMIELGIFNSRMKDFYDVYILLKHNNISNINLQNAIINTFKQRNTVFVENHELFSQTFCVEKNRQIMWKAFLRKIKHFDNLEFPFVVKSIVERLYPIYFELRNKKNKTDMNNPPRIVFMGTPEFAVESLRRLVESGYNVVGVVTAPDKPVGKHHSVLQASPVKEYALSKDIPILQPDKLKDADFLEQLSAWNADLQIVVAFRMLPEAVWNMPRLGTFNLHASLLPQYRGAAPIQWAIINGEKETGVTTFFLTYKIDTGKIIAQERIPVESNDTASIIHDRLMYLGAELVIKTVDMIINNQIHPVEQETLIMNESNLKPAPKIFKETCEIDWNKTSEEIYNLIRGLSPYPAAWTILQTSKRESVQCKIFETEMIVQAHQLTPGTIDSSDSKHLKIATSDGFIQVKSIQQAGKKRMSTEDFLRGNAQLFVQE